MLGKILLANSLTIAGQRSATVPGAPAIVTAVAGNGQATVSFSAPFTGGSPITGYVVTGTPGGSAGGPASPIVVTGLTNGLNYTFKVVAINAVGTGPASVASNIVTPSAPGTLTASANPFSVKVDYPGYTPPAGKVVASIAATGNSPGGIFSSTVGGGGQATPYTHFPLLSQGQGGSLSSSTSFTLDVVVNFTDSTSQNLGNTPSVTVPATNGSIIPTNGLMYKNGIFYGKGDFNFGGMLTDYYYNDSGLIVCRCTESTGGGGHQPYWPATGSAGVDTSAFTHLQFVMSASIANPRYIVYFMAFNDVGDGNNVTDIGTNAAYGTTTLVSGSYGTYTIPLSTFALGAPQVLKYNIGFEAPQSSGAWFNIETAQLI